MKSYWKLSLLLLATGCAGPQIWYQTGKTPAQAHQDWTDCQIQARSTQPAQITLRPGIISAMQSDDWRDIATSCMRGKGYTPTPAKAVADPAQWPEH